ncbi:response regulator [Pseudomonas putida]|uniref:Response regulator n=1 Tax=Pseudomonas putida TaxID=303 RepID=A0A7V8J3V3_PSEPU|nr:response regulator [Pseudomonas putida]KAF0254029.1 response regulator [Pseudomonas putida]
MTEKKRVMVLDDSKTIRTTTEGYLRELDYDVQCCTDGLNGISHMLDFNPDILLIDMEMPRMNGLQTVRLIRGNSRFKNTPIVMLSSKDGMFDMALASDAGANDYIVKPPEKAALQAVIKKHLG